MCVPVYQLQDEYCEAEKIFLANGGRVIADQTEIHDELQRVSTYGNAPVSDERAKEMREKFEEMRDLISKRSPLAEEWRKMGNEAFALY